MIAAMFKLFIMFFRIGLFSFGGGYVMLPLIYQGILEFGIMSAREFSNLVALSQMTPGPIAVNAATYVGYKYAGISGAAAATIGVALPSFILVLLVSHFLSRFKESRGLNAVLDGVRPATVGLLASAVIFLAETSIVTSEAFTGAILEDPAGCVNAIQFLFFIAAFAISYKYRIGPIKITIAAGIAGAFIIR